MEGLIDEFAPEIVSIELHSVVLGIKVRQIFIIVIVVGLGIRIAGQHHWHSKFELHGVRLNVFWVELDVRDAECSKKKRICEVW